MSNLASISESEIPIKDQPCATEPCNYVYPVLNIQDNPQNVYPTQETSTYEHFAPCQENIVDVDQCSQNLTVNQYESHGLNINKYFQINDSPEFMEFMKTISLTGEHEIDKEIFEFYRSKFT